MTKSRSAAGELLAPEPGRRGRGLVGDQSGVSMEGPYDGPSDVLNTERACPVPDDGPSLLSTPGLNGEWRGTDRRGWPLDARPISAETGIAAQTPWSLTSAVGRTSDSTCGRHRPAR